MSNDRIIQQEPGSRLDMRLALVIYVRILAVVFLASGLQNWAILLGPLSPDGNFLSQPLALVVATIFFAVFNLVAGVGLWLLSSWGTVVWLMTALTETALHAAFRPMFEFQPALIGFHVGSVLIYLVLTWLYERNRDR
jgi:Family of unknown function (DUF6163)